MNDRLDDKIRSLMVEVVEATPAVRELEEIFELRLSVDPVPVVPQLRPRLGFPPRQRWLVAVAAAAAVLVLVGGVALLSLGTGSDSAVATTPQIDSLSSLTWSRVPHDEAVFGGEFGQSMYDVTVGGPGLVAVGESGWPRNFDAAVWTSPDGITWSRVPHNEAVFGGEASQAMTSVTAGGPGLVAVGYDAHNSSAAVWTSPDGITWSRVPHNEEVFGGAAMSNVAVGGPGLVAVGRDGDPQTNVGNDVMWTSPDGITWSRVPYNEEVFGGDTGVWLGGDTARIWDVIDVGPGLVAVGVDVENTAVFENAAVWTSPDGITWSRVPHDEAVFGGQPQASIDSVIVGGPGLVAVGESGSEHDFDAAVWIATVDD